MIATIIGMVAAAAWLYLVVFGSLGQTIATADAKSPARYNP